MHASRKPSPVAQSSRETSGFLSREAQSPEQSASATSGTYFRALRPTVPEAAPTAWSASPIDDAKIEGLRFELEVGIWRGDSERIAQCVIDDADHDADSGDDAER